MYVMLKYVLDVEPEDPLAPKILQDFLTFMKGFVSIPLYVPGSPYAKAVKVYSSLFFSFLLLRHEISVLKSVLLYDLQVVSSGQSGFSSLQSTAWILLQATDSSHFYALGLELSRLCRDKWPYLPLGTAAKHPLASISNTRRFL